MVGGELVVEDEPEFNVGQDPAAAVAVLKADVPTTVYPVDLFESVVVAPALVERLRNAPAPAARLAGELLDVRRHHMLGDAGAVVFLIHPQLFEVRRTPVAVVDRRLIPVSDSGGWCVHGRRGRGRRWPRRGGGLRRCGRRVWPAWSAGMI